MFLTLDLHSQHLLQRHPGKENLSSRVTRLSWMLCFRLCRELPACDRSSLQVDICLPWRSPELWRRQRVNSIINNCLKTSVKGQHQTLSLWLRATGSSPLFSVAPLIKRPIINRFTEKYSLFCDRCSAGTSIPHQQREERPPRGHRCVSQGGLSRSAFFRPHLITCYA